MGYNRSPIPFTKKIQINNRYMGQPGFPNSLSFQAGAIPKPTDKKLIKGERYTWDPYEDPEGQTNQLYSNEKTNNIFDTVLNRPQAEEQFAATPPIKKPPMQKLPGKLNEKPAKTNLPSPPEGAEKEKDTIMNLAGSEITGKVSPQAPVLPDATQQPLKTTPGKSGIVTVGKSSATQGETSKTKEIAGGFDPQAKDVVSDIMQQTKTNRDESDEFKKAYPQYATPQARLEARQGIANDQKTALAQKLQEYTSSMDHAQEAAFWQKIIGGLGKGIAGVVGLNTGLNVGGAYKDPELTTYKEFAEPVQARYGAEKEAIKGQYEADKGIIDEAEKIIEGLNLSYKDQTTLLRALNAAKAAKTVESGTTNTQSIGSEQKVVTPPMPRAPKNSALKGADGYIYKDYLEATADVIQSLNRFDDKIKTARTPEEFAMTLAEYTTPVSAPKDGVSVPIRKEAILNRYKELAPQLNNDFIQTRDRIISELLAIAGGHFDQVAPDDLGYASMIAKQYGFPIQLIIPGTPSKPGGEGSFSPPTAKKQPAPNAVPTAKAPNKDQVYMWDKKGVRKIVGKKDAAGYASKFGFSYTAPKK
jgi:hypothetical protein